MQIGCGLHYTVAEFKVAEENLAGSIINGKLTFSYSKHISNQKCYILSSEEIVITALIPEKSTRPRCLVLIPIPLKAKWISAVPFEAKMLHVVDDNNGKRMLGSRTYIDNVDSKLLYIFRGLVVLTLIVIPFEEKCIIAIPLEAKWLRVTMLHLVDGNNGKTMLSSRSHVHDADLKLLYIFRCLFVLTLIVIPLEAKWIIFIPFEAEWNLLKLLHLEDGNNGKRTMVSRTYVRNVDSKLHNVSPKGLQQIRGKDPGQIQQQYLECLRNVVKLNLVFGPKLLQQFMKISLVSVEKISRVTILGNNASTSKHCSSNPPLDNSNASNLVELDIDSFEPYMNKTNVRSSGYMKSSSNGAIAVANKEGATGFSLCGSCVTETMLAARSGPGMGSELFTAPIISSACFHVSYGDHIGISTCQINSLASLSQLAYDRELFAVGKSEALPSLHLHTNPPIKEAINMDGMFVDRNNSQGIDITQGVQASENSSDPLRTQDNQAQSDQSLNVQATGSADSKSQTTMNSELPGSSYIASGSDSVSGTSNKGSHKIFCAIGDEWDRNCTNDSGRKRSGQSNTGKAKDKFIEMDENFGHDFKFGASRETPVVLRRNRKLREHTFLRNRGGMGMSQKFCPLNACGRGGKGSNHCFWKKVEKSLGDDHVKPSKICDHSQSNSAKILQNEAQVKSLTTNTSLLSKQKTTGLVCSKEQYFEDPKRHIIMLQSEIPLDDISGKLREPVKLSGYQLAGQDASVPELPVLVKEKQNTGRVDLQVQKRVKSHWTRKTGFSGTNNSKDPLQKEDGGILQKSIHLKSMDTEPGDPQPTSYLTVQMQGDITQDLKNDCSSMRSSMKIHSPLSQAFPISGASKVVNETVLHTKQRASQIRSSGQAPETQLTVDEVSLCPLPCKGKITPVTEKGKFRERNNERHHNSQQISQKWVPVESKSARSSASDTKAADTLDSSVVCSIVVEDESSGLNPDFSGEVRLANTRAKARVHEVGTRRSQSQTKIPGYPLKILEETVKNTSDHGEHAASQIRLGSDPLCIAVANDSSLPDESNINVYTVLKAIHTSYKYHLASEHISHMTGDSLAEFEKVLDAVSPVIMSIPGKQQCCKSKKSLLDKSLICNCQIPDISLKSIWQWYEEPCNYGLEVKAQDLGGEIDGNLFRAYFVPFLSGMQLFGLSATSASSFTIPECSIRQNRKIQFGKLPILSALLPKPTVEDDSTIPKCLGLSFGSCGKTLCSCNSSSENLQLLFEFFESEQPHQRRPLFDKIRHLTRGSVGSSSQIFGDPSILSSMKIGNLHPASWYAVAWYPIYRVPEGQLRAAFLTYHSLGRFTHGSVCSSSVGSTDTGIVAPVVGLQSYSSQSECWFHLKKCHESFPVETFLSNPSELEQERLRALEETATSMSRVLTKTQALQRSRHSDYEFFLSHKR